MNDEEDCAVKLDSSKEGRDKEVGRGSGLGNANRPDDIDTTNSKLVAKTTENKNNTK
jgi:hypothetical protein